MQDSRQWLPSHIMNSVPKRLTEKLQPLREIDHRYFPGITR